MMRSRGLASGSLNRRTPLSWLADGLQARRPFKAYELILALIALGVVALLALGPHLRHGGFYIDDWSNAALSLQPPHRPSFGQALSAFANVTIYRPVLVVYVPLTYFVFGMHMHEHLAWAAFLAVFAATMLYGILRICGVPWIHALLAAALTVVFPWSDSTRLWATADQVTLAIAFAGAGLLIALLGLRRHSARWHVLSAVLYLLSILTYEITLPLIVTAGVVYYFQAGWRRARWRWFSDICVGALGGIWVGVHTTRTTAGVAGDIEHLKQIVSGGAYILGRAGLPLGASQESLVIATLAAVLAAGLMVIWAFPAGGGSAEREWGLRGWVLLALGGLMVAAVGWIMFIPADPYYTPSIFGETNRVNGLAAFGLVLLVYGGLGTAASLAGRLLPRGQLVAAGVATLLGIVLMGAYTHVLRRHISIWDTAFVAQRRALVKMQHELPSLSPYTTVFASSYPANQTLGVPIFTSSWGLDGAVKMEYGDSTLTARPVRAELHLVCALRGVVLEDSSGEHDPPAPYGTAQLIDLTTGRHSALGDRRQCERVTPSYLPGPLYLSTSY